MIVTELPQKIIAGDTVEWTESLSDFPADSSWVVTYSFTGPKGQFSSGHAANGSDHDISIATDDLDAGRYDFQKKVTDGSTTHTLAFGYVEVEPDLAGDSGAVDRREYAEIALDNIEAMLQGKASRDQTSYSLNGRALSRYSVEELQTWRAQLRSEVRGIRAKKRMRSGGKSHRNIRLRMPGNV